MPEPLQVDAQLVAPTGQRRQFETSPRGTVEALEDAIACEARAAEVWIDDLDRRPHLALAQRPVDRAFVRRGVARGDGDVALLDLAPFELARERSVRVGIQGEHDHPAGVAIESVHDAGPGPLRLGAGHEAVGLLRTDARHREKPRRLVEDDEESIVVEHSHEPVDYGFMLSTSLIALALAGLPQDAAPAPTPEAANLRGVVQLTAPERFLKAGEAYFAPGDDRIVFQAIERPADGSTPEDFYAMFVADVVREGDRIASLANIRRVSPEGSANTCGWFHPKDPNTLFFATTVGAPTASDPPGYERGTGRYRWMFPPEMRIVSVDLRTADGSPGSLAPVVGDGTAYVAEGAVSPDGRWLIYTDLSTNQGDLRVLDLLNGGSTPVVVASGYDGGPFFAPDGKRIVYRSDRAGTNLLQVHVADLAFDDSGAITGIEQEHQITRNEHVNWCPFFHPSGRFVVFASSAVSHRNYEVFAADATTLERDGVRQSRYGTNLRRVTFADGADVLPVFSHDGRWMMWTGQRGDDRSSQLYVAEWVMPADPMPSGGRSGG